MSLYPSFAEAEIKSAGMLERDVDGLAPVNIPLKHASAFYFRLCKKNAATSSAFQALGTSAGLSQPLRAMPTP